jgi:hypothetical protein
VSDELEVAWNNVVTAYFGTAMERVKKTPKHVGI